MTIPILDLEAQHASIRAELDAAIERVMAHGKFVSGPDVEAFEGEFAAHCGAAHAIGLSNGTAALELGLRATGVKPGDEVITSATTFMATVEAIVLVGAVPVLVDPNPDTGLIEAEAAEAAITDRTKALLPVHLWGQTVDLEAFRRLADERGLVLAEDACQAVGAKWNDKIAGSVGDFAAFSFFPGKNLGCLGDGGAATTGDEALAQEMRTLRNHGRAAGDKVAYSSLGTNARLDTLQAAILSAKLPHLDGWTEGRRKVAAAYDAAFAEIDGVEPIVTRPEARHVYHQYVIRVPERDAAVELLRERGVAAAVHYPRPLSREPVLEGVADPDAFPNADRLAAEVISIPAFPELSATQRETVVSAVMEHAASLTRSG